MDERYLGRALELAQEAWGETHPNPMVGAVIVEDNEIVSEGYHARAGDRHAEIVALDNLGRPPSSDAVLFLRGSHRQKRRQAGYGWST
jgi:diaminohydroxyphosphoribosylaminopyrimidine deaminase/5-amino-6-(5-phosphoribosylamino)uracil reductase